MLQGSSSQLLNHDVARSQTALFVIESFEKYDPSKEFDKCETRIVSPIKDAALPDTDIFPFLARMPHRLRILIRENLKAVLRKGKIVDVFVKFEDTQFVKLKVVNLVSYVHCEAVALLDPATIESELFIKVSPSIAEPKEKFVQMEIKVIYSLEGLDQNQFIFHDVCCQMTSDYGNLISDATRDVLDRWRMLPQWTRDSVRNASLWMQAPQRSLDAIETGRSLIP